MATEYKGKVKSWDAYGIKIENFYTEGYNQVPLFKALAKWTKENNHPWIESLRLNHVDDGDDHYIELQVQYCGNIASNLI